mgnify:FL=1
MENLDFARLRYEGENHPYTGHPAARSSMPENYYLLLMTILTSAEANEAQWMHLYRIAKGARCTGCAGVAALCAQYHRRKDRRVRREHPPR